MLPRGEFSVYQDSHQPIDGFLIPKFISDGNHHNLSLNVPLMWCRCTRGIVLYWVVMSRLHSKKMVLCLQLYEVQWMPFLGTYHVGPKNIVMYTGQIFMGTVTDQMSWRSYGCLSIEYLIHVILYIDCMAHIEIIWISGQQRECQKGGIEWKGLTVTWLSACSFGIENALVNSKNPARYIYILCSVDTSKITLSKNLLSKILISNNLFRTFQADGNNNNGNENHGLQIHSIEG